MKIRHTFTTVVLAGMAFATGVRADYLVSRHSFGPGEMSFLSALQRYSNSGADLGLFARSGDESIDEAVVAPDGSVYTIGNNLGTGIVRKYGSDGTFINGLNAPSVALPGGVALGWGQLFVGSSKFTSSSVTGVTRFDPVSLQFIDNAIPYTDSPTLQQVVLDLQFGPDDKLYVADRNVVQRYLRLANGTIVHNDGYSVPITASTGQVGSWIAFRPGGSSLYVSKADRSAIDEYDVNGVFVRTLAPVTALGLGHISGFTFGDNGILYVGSPDASGPNAEVLRFDATTGNYLGSSPALHGRAYEVVFAVPEPTAFLLVVGALPLFLSRRRVRT